MIVSVTERVRNTLFILSGMRPAQNISATKKPDGTHSVSSCCYFILLFLKPFRLFFLIFRSTLAVLIHARYLPPPHCPLVIHLILILNFWTRTYNIFLFYQFLFTYNFLNPLKIDVLYLGFFTVMIIATRTNYKSHSVYFIKWFVIYAYFSNVLFLKDKS